MMKKRAKLEMETLGKILLLTAFLIIFLLMFKGCKDQMTNVGRVGLNEYVCWFSHALKADLTFLFPSGCQTIDVEKLQTETDIARLMRACWWMHGQGDKDITTGESLAGILAQRSIWWYDIARTCYVFTPDKDIPVTDLENYLRRRDKSGKEVEKDSKATAWHYIQKTGREEIGICMDSREEKLQKGKRYFIIFYDDRSPLSQGVRDRILISRDPNFGEKEVGFITLLRSGVKTVGQFLGILKPWDNNICYLWEDMIRKEEKRIDAKRFFDKLVNTLQRCMQITGNKVCICDNSELDPLNELPEEYSIRFKKIEEKKYEVSLLDENKKVYKERDEEFKRVLDGARLGSWADRKKERTPTTPSCLPGIINEYTIDKYLVSYYVIYHPNNEYHECFIERSPHNPKIEDFVAAYLTQERLTGLKKCSETS